jgi:transposase
VIPASVRIFVCTQPLDLRRSFDGLALATRQVLGEDPQSGALFCFLNRRSNRLKVLWWDRNGYCLLYKRLHRARFGLPGSGGVAKGAIRIDAEALAELIRGIPREEKRRVTH